jgi:fatty-acyl-CoA synthase
MQHNTIQHDNNRDIPMRLADFGHLSEALDYAAKTSEGMNFYSTRGEREHNLSYKTIRHDAITLARAMIALGVKRGDRVGIIAEMSPDFITSFFACQYAGTLAVPLPVVTGLGGLQGYETHLKTVIENSETTIVLGSLSSLDSLTRASQNTCVKTVTTAQDLMIGEKSDAPLNPLNDHEVSHIQFSSGSTRYPLGIEINQSAIMANSHSIATTLNFTKEDRVASWLPFYHDMGLVGCLIVPVTCQLSVDYLYTDSFARRPVQWLKMISDNRCTMSFSPTFGFELCSRRMNGKNEEGLDLSSWRVAGIGGDMIQNHVMEKFATDFKPYGFNAHSFMPSYGLAEATLAFSFQDLGLGVTVDYVDKNTLSDKGIAQSVAVSNSSETPFKAIASCGKPMNEYQLDIRDEDGQSLPDRHVGGVFIHAPSLMTGYYKNNSATQACIAEDGWLDTGDMGYTVDRTLYITGRRKDMILINGRNIWPQDLEWYAEHKVEGVKQRDTAAFEYEDEFGQTVVILLVQCRTSQTEKRDQLKKDVRDTVLKYTGVDARIELIPPRSLPFTTSGKLSRTRAKKIWLSGQYGS